ncbi:hypothetical protein HGI30_01615 [Paenibacillus albicereus]|uniref:Uncharacterized protein n=1 Tax=Paenibacillus albicereus TaxID=2726185 RepID=A0A6H2GSP4_9BACL|nr:hypothetical protein [Paenibacillus albicereus]QJC50415.1 hypothetical protein HGI30_01615 [Paenibacillus albicereus]
MKGFSFGGGLTLVHLEASSPRLFAAEDQLDCRYVRAYFKQQGTPTAQYIQASLAGRYETAEDLLSLGNDAVAFHVTPASYRLCRELSGTLADLDGSLRIFWFGEWAAELPDRSLPATVERLVRSEPERVLHRLLEPDAPDEAADEMDALDAIAGVWEEAASMRQAPLLAVKASDRLGGASAPDGLRLHSPERLARDIRLAAAASRQARPELRLIGYEAATADEAREAAVAEALEACGGSATWSVELTLERWRSGGAARLAERGASTLTLRLPDSLDETEPFLSDMLRELRIAWPELRLRVVLETSPGSTESGSRRVAGQLRQCLDEGLLARDAITAAIPAAAGAEARMLLPAPLEELARERLGSSSEAALVNGFLAFMTGHYPPHALGGGAKHIGVDEDGWRPETIRRMGEHSALNSAIFFEQNQENRDESLDIIEPPIFYDQDGRWKRLDRRFDRAGGEAEREGVYLSNANRLDRDESGRWQLRLNDFLLAEPISLQRQRYEEAAAEDGACEPAAFRLLELRSERDLDRFLDDVDGFSRTGRFAHGYEVQSHVMDSCRWSAAGACSARKLPRLFADKEGEVASCRGCAPIGHLDDTPDQLLLQAAVLSDQEQLLRGCSSCEIRSTCSQCAFLPPYMTASQYCAIRREHVMLHRYMQVVQLVKGLRRHTQALSALDAETLLVSLPTCTHYYPHPGMAARPSLVSEAVFLLTTDGTPVLYQAVSQKVLKLSEPMALLLEGLMVGATEAELAEALQAKYGTEPAYAAAAVSQAIEQFSRQGCLHLPARAS